MLDILQKIIHHKRLEVEHNKALYPTKLLEQSIFFSTENISLKQYILRPDKLGVIAEIKRKSPSRGIINNYIDVEKLSIGYMQAGASALSVLSDREFFGGSNEDVTVARRFNYCPILRKDFILDEYQVLETKSIGADAILLIAAILEPKQTLQLAQTAKGLGLEVLLECISQEEIENYTNEYIDLVGINNRDLKDFNQKLETSFKLAEYLPKDKVKIAESDISSSKDIVALKNAGYDGFLIGENFMKTPRPEKTCEIIINETWGLLEKQEASEI